MNDTVHKDSNNKSANDLEIEALQATEASLKQSVATLSKNGGSAKVLAREKHSLKQVQDRLKDITPKATQSADK